MKLTDSELKSDTEKKTIRRLNLDPIGIRRRLQALPLLLYKRRRISGGEK